MRTGGFVLVFLMAFLPASADHITGGETHYTLLSITNGQYRYHVTVKLFMDCFSNRQFSNPGVIGIFNKGTNARVTDVTVSLANQETLNLTDAGPCITNPPAVCYKVAYYIFDVTLPGSADGYVLATQVNYRVNGISNLTSGYSNVGATYCGEIPGTNSHPDGPNNNSARFTGDDMVIVCANNSFTYDFGAVDNDTKDVLSYSFCEAYVGGSIGGGGNATPPNPPPYFPVPYGNGFNGSVPLGIDVKINPNTGMITGIAPSEGTYVVTVCVQEIRDSKVIATQRKDLQIKITSCNVAAASIPPAYMLCGNTQTINLVNLSTSPLINSHNWEIFNEAGSKLFSATTPTASFNFTDTGTYSVRLVINRNGQCADSSTAIARVYPGFEPAFTVAGICVNKPTQFHDATTSVYGIVNKWSWDFAQPGDPAALSIAQHPIYTYSSLGVKNVRLIVNDSKGCIDTLFKPISIVDKPPILLAFRDTLICPPDALRLKANGGGIFSWDPAPTLTDGNTPTPTVSPVVNSKYYVTLNDNGCINRDSVQVRVVDHVTLEVMDDTIICQSDAIQLRLTSDALRYEWTPPQQLINPYMAIPTATTPITTLYKVTAFISNCRATGDVEVKAVPYPVANAGPDIMICHDAMVQLNGSTDGKSVDWTPASTLSNPKILNPVAKPKGTTDYVLAAYDDKGCTKAGRDTVKVTVLPDIIAFAGRDTAAIVGQPMHLQASGGIKYTWIPAEGLSASDIANPVVTHFYPSPGIKYKVLVYNEANCVDSAFVMVRVFKTRPSIFVPSAFSPNGDRNNDVFRFIAAGMERIEFFQVFNRWGQMVYSTTSGETGWDGTLGGKPQSPGMYVWSVKAVDYTGAIYTQKGTVTLVR
ncbi:gliding motility-associated C-terminal domain-containing protein [Paraflavitalea sp. CAU 1676]|uniref:T9SS type B sorting domain-containing protein n=1 Tax=Paraflavitalea sp. CAU 1676 TaxID=3032598 RepID=UPI0023DCAC01|nr:gliding motility-associated C-terminal domain-containing protein [Paraflavitalea sp. CAU 1676]MDF2190076.1 gliding motility-associated C-terminal domain-containing protein [Paraflavitalea sp. CAU 1676]